MGRYYRPRKKKLDPEQIARAKAVPLMEYLERAGYAFKRDGNTKFRLVEHDSLVITPSVNRWIWNSAGIGGDVIDFLVKYEGKGFADAVIELTQEMPAGRVYPVQARAAPDTEIAKKEKPTLPPANPYHGRVYAYLTKTRGISPTIVRDLFKTGELYESAGTHNAVFVRRVDGEPRYCFMRGTSTYKTFRGEIPFADGKRYAWQNVAADEREIYVFEAILDALAYATLTTPPGGNWRDKTLVTLGGTAMDALEQFFVDHPKRCGKTTVHICTDADEGGEKAAEHIRAVCARYGNPTCRLLPTAGKDWNDTLLAYRSKSTLDPLGPK